MVVVVVCGVGRLNCVGRMDSAPLHACFPLQGASLSAPAACAFHTSLCLSLRTLPILPPPLLLLLAAAAAFYSRLPPQSRPAETELRECCACVRAAAATLQSARFCVAPKPLHSTLPVCAQRPLSTDVNASKLALCTTCWGANASGAMPAEGRALCRLLDRACLLLELGLQQGGREDASLMSGFDLLIQVMLLITAIWPERVGVH